MQKNLTTKRGRPRKAKNPPKKNGRPKLLSALEKRIEIMKDVVVLNTYGVPWTAAEKIAFLSERYCVSTKQIEACITYLNRLANNNGVLICHECHEVRFVLDPSSNTSFRHIKAGGYAKR